jgi:hypothetical protein
MTMHTYLVRISGTQAEAYAYLRSVSLTDNPRVTLVVVRTNTTPAFVVYRTNGIGASVLTSLMHGRIGRKHIIDIASEAKVDATKTTTLADGAVRFESLEPDWKSLYTHLAQHARPQHCRRCWFAKLAQDDVKRQLDEHLAAGTMDRTEYDRQLAVINGGAL